MVTSDLFVSTSCKLTRQIGIGVFRCRRTGRVVVRKKFIRSPRTRPSFWLREMTLLRSLVHPNICAFVDGYYMPPERACLYMEHCDLGSLGDFQRGMTALGKLLPRSFVWHVFESLARALMYCHTGITGLEHGRRNGWQLEPDWCM